MNICLLLVCALSFPTIAFADTLVTNYSIYDEPNLPKPAYLISMIDPYFHTTITRVTNSGSGGIWGNRATHNYNLDQAWNADMTYLLIYNADDSISVSQGFMVLDGATYQYLPAKSSSVCNLYPDEIRWHPVNPNLLVYTKGNKLREFNITTGIDTLLHAFTEYPDVQYSLWLKWKGNLSNDGNWIALYHVFTDSGDVFAYDISHNVKHTVRKFPISFGLGSLSMSASGNYVVVSVDENNNWVYDREMNLLKSFGVGISHYDLALDPFNNNADAAVGRCATAPDNGDVIKVPLAGNSGAYTVLCSSGYATHASARNLRRLGWVYVSFDEQLSNYPGHSTWAPFYSEVVAVKLDGSGAIERLAHTHGDAGDYYSQTQCSVSPDGMSAIFKSDWRSPGGLRPVDSYVTDMRALVVSPISSTRYNERHETNLFSCNTTAGTINYSLPKLCFVSIKYYDLQGRIVCSLVNKYQEAGNYNLELPEAALARKIYIRAFRAGDFVKKELLAVARKD